MVCLLTQWVVTQWNADGSHSNAYWANKSSKAIKENR